MKRNVLALVTNPNTQVMIARLNKRIAELELMWAVNSEWHDRAWNTPDMAMCLGRRYKSAKQERRYQEHEVSPPRPVLVRVK